MVEAGSSAGWQYGQGRDVERGQGHASRIKTQIRPELAQFSALNTIALGGPFSAKFTMGAGEAALLGDSHMYRSLTLAFVVLYSAAAAAGDFPSAYVAPGGIYAPSARIYVDSGSGHREPLYAERGHAYGQPSYVTPSPAYGAPESGYGENEPEYSAPPVYVERAPAYLRRDYATEFAPRPPLPVPYGARARCVVNLGYGRWAYCN
jgi:hypothetical protein